MVKEYIFEYNDKQYVVQVNYKKGLRNIHFRYRDDKFVVSSPYLVSKNKIFEGLRKHADYLLKHAENEKPAGDNYLYILGIKTPISDQGEINFTNGNKIVYKSRDDLNKKLRKYYLDLVTRRVRYYEQIMKVESYNVRVKNMKTRLGSNSRKTKTLYFSLSLLSYSYDVIDSVVIHELTHILVFNHSKEFYKILYRYCPNYDECRKRLREAQYHA